MTRTKSMLRGVRKYVPNQLFTKCICFLLIITLLSMSTPEAPAAVISVAGNVSQDVRYRFLSSQLAIDFPYLLTAIMTPKARVKSRSANRIQIYPGSMTIKQGTKAVFSAVAFDGDNEPLSGLNFEWTATDSAKRVAPLKFSSGVFDGVMPGEFVIRAESQSNSAEVTLTVLPPQPDELEQSRAKSTTNSVISSRSARSGSDVKKVPSEPGDDTSNGDNWRSIDDPGNTPGNPPGGPAADGAGSGNFQLTAPIISLPGRGTDLALNLNYNSRVWNKSGNQLTFDIDHGFPSAPGWTLGFGKIEFMGSGGCMMVDADGTRHSYGGLAPTTWSTGMSFNGHTADGTFIDYGCSFTYGSYGYGWAKLPNGTQLNYSTIGPGNSHVYPTLITDVQGNYITITYRNLSDPQIETVTDTMGRVTTFNYDSLNRLISVTAPRMQGEDPN